MKPAARTLAKGIDQAKPPSGMLAIYGWRRVMRDCGRHEPDMAPASRILRGLIEQLKQRCGQDAMAPDHHIPYPLQSILRAVKYLDTYSNPAWTASYHDSLALAIRFNLARGPRIDEWCEMYTGDSYYRRGNFCWMLDSVLLDERSPRHPKRRADHHLPPSDQRPLQDGSQRREVDRQIYVVPSTEQRSAQLRARVGKV